MINKMRLLDVCDFQGGTQPPKNEWVSEPQDGYVRMLQIRDYSQGAEKFIEYVKNTGKLHMCSEDDIMLSRYGYIGQAFTGLAGAYNVALVKVIKKREIDTKYLFYYFQSAYFQHSLLSNVGSRATIPGFNKSELENTLIPIPSIDDQVKIGAVLSKLDKMLGLHQEQLVKLDQLVKSRFIELFGDPETNPMGWNTEELEKHLSVVGGYAFKSDGFLDSGIPVLRIGNINSGHFLPVNMVFWSEDASLSRYKMYPGDLVMSLTGTVGKDDYGNVCILGNDYAEYYLNQRNAKLDLKPTLNKHYLSEMLKFGAIKKRLTGISRGVRQANISNKDILSLCVPIPSVELQEKFAAFIDQTDKSKLAIQQSLEKLELLKKSLMQEYFG